MAADLEESASPPHVETATPNVADAIPKSMPAGRLWPEPYQFTHRPLTRPGYAAVNALFGGPRRFQVDNRVIPGNQTSCDPRWPA